jgi:hypothetical protein
MFDNNLPVLLFITFNNKLGGRNFGSRFRHLRPEKMFHCPVMSPQNVFQCPVNRVSFHGRSAIERCLIVRYFVSVPRTCSSLPIGKTFLNLLLLNISGSGILRKKNLQSCWQACWLVDVICLRSSGRVHDVSRKVGGLIVSGHPEDSRYRKTCLPGRCRFLPERIFADGLNIG